MMGVANTGTGAKRFFSFFIVHPPHISLALIHTYFSVLQNTGFLPVINPVVVPTSGNQ